MNVFGTRLNGEELDITIAFCYYVIIKLPAEKAGNALGSVAEWFNALVTHKWTNRSSVGSNPTASAGDQHRDSERNTVNN